MLSRERPAGRWAEIMDAWSGDFRDYAHLAESARVLWGDHIHVYADEEHLKRKEEFIRACEEAHWAGVICYVTDLPVAERKVEVDTQSGDIRWPDKVQRLAAAVFPLGEWDSFEEAEDWVGVACRDETHALALQEMLCGDLDYRAVFLNYIEANVTIYNRTVLMFMNAGQRTDALYGALQTVAAPSAR